MLYYKKNKTNKAVFCQIILNIDEKTDTGMAHLLEHLIMKYNSVYSKKDIRKYRALYEINAQTFPDYISFSFYTSKNNFKNALTFLSNLIYNLNVEQKCFLMEKNIVFDEIKESSLNHESINYCKIIKTITNSTDFDILGNKTNLEKLTLKKLNNFYKKITAEPVDIYLNGNISKNKAKKFCYLYFNCEKKYIPSIKAPTLIPPQKNNTKALNSYFFLNYAFPMILSPSIKIEAYLRNLQYFSDLIMNKIYKDENQILYNFETNYIIYHNLIVFYFTYSCNKFNYKLISNLFHSVINDLKNLTHKDLEELIIILKDSSKKYIEMPNEQYVYENIKNFKKIYTEKDFLKIRQELNNLPDFNNFLNNLFKDNCYKIITSIR